MLSENLAPDPLVRLYEEVDARYVDMGKANGMTFFQCKELELLEGVNRAQTINCRGRSCKRTL